MDGSARGTDSWVKAAAVAAGAGLLWTACRRKAVQERSFTESARLNAEEQQLHDLLAEDSVQTATLLRPKAGGGVAQADVAGHFRERVVEIVMRNKWLVGETRRLGADKAWHLTWRDDVSRAEAEECFEYRRVAADDKLLLLLRGAAQRMAAQGELPRSGLADACRMVNETYPMGTRRLGGKRLFRVLLLEAEAEGQAAADGGREYIVVSALNHSIGDGGTYYKLHGMLSEGAAPRPLEVQRQLLSDRTRFKDFLPAGCEGFNVLGVLPVLMGIKLGEFLSSWCPWLAPLSTPPGHGVFELNVEAVAALKESLKDADIPFVSTNDVVSSWWHKAYPGRVYEFTMPVNLRGRVPGVHADHAGNYLAVLCISGTENDITPGCIRKVLSAGRNTTPYTPMSLLQKLRSPLVQITNWSTFYCQLRLPSYDEAVHLPLPGLFGIGHFAVVFALGENKLGLYLDSAPGLKPTVSLRTGRSELLLRQLTRA